MQPRSEPLLWLQCLALGAIPLELLVIRLVLAGADPGPVPGVERFLIWGVGVLAPTVALWRRPADWGSLLLVRQPLASRSSDQLRISASHSGLSSRIAVLAAAVILLPTLWWLDDSAVLVNEFSPVSGQSRLVSLLLVSPLLALIVWQLQQLVQAAAVLVGSATTIAAADSTFRAETVATQRTSLGLQLLNLPALDWPEAQADPSTEGIVEDADVDAPAVAEDSQDQDKSETDPSNNEIPDETIDAKPAEPETDDGTENETTVQDSTDINRGMPEDSDELEAEELKLDNDDMNDSSNSALDVDSAEDEAAEDDSAEDDSAEDDVESEAGSEENANPSASPESVTTAAAPVPVEPEQPGEEEEGTALDPEISQFDTVASGSTEGHREQAEPSGGKESEPEQSSEPPPGSL